MISEEVAAHRKSAIRKASLRLVPILGIGYFFNYIDRTNISIAALQMNDDLGISAVEFGIAAGIFYIGYCLLEVPSNLALYRFGARRWLARIMITWGLLCAAMAFAYDARSFQILRLLAGAAEAGFFPGVIFFLSVWFPVEYRARILGWFILAIPLSSFIGGPLGIALLSLDGLLGLRGWQWLFILEGLPACLLGILTFRLLADRPEDAKWLTAEERAALTMQIEEPGPAKHGSLLAAAKDPRVLLLGASYFCFLIGSLGIGIWLPLIIKSSGYSVTAAGWLSAIPYAAACVALYFASRWIDRSRKYLRAHLFGCIGGAAGFLVAVLYSQPLIAFGGLILALTSMNAFRPALFSIPSQFLTGAGAAAGIALINSFGNLGGFVGPYMIGAIKDSTGSYVPGMIALCAMLVLAAIFAAMIPVVERKLSDGR